MKSAGARVDEVGLKRTYEAVEGDWPSFIYIPVDKLDSLHRSCVEHFRESNCIDVKDIVTSDKGLHISLSKQFTLRHHHISAFIRKLGEELQSVFRNRFCLEVYSEYYILNNDNMTRSFVCLPVEDRSGTLLKLVNVIDTVMRSFNRPKYYQVPKFHLSVASLPYRESSLSEVIIEVPSIAEKSKKVLQDSEVTNIYQFSSKYCVSDSSEDEEQPSSKTLPGHSLGTSDAASLGVSTRSGMTFVDNRYETISCSLIECSIGNRLFRLSGDNQMNGKNEFQEILHDDAVSSGKRSRII